MHSSRTLTIDWAEFGERLSSRPYDVNGLTLFYLVTVGVYDERGITNFHGTDDKNPVPIGIAKKILNLARFKTHLRQSILLNALMNNGITTSVFQCIVEKIRRSCPKFNMLEEAFKHHNPVESDRNWSRCKTNAQRKLWLLL